MAFCTSCGKKLEEGKKFCTNCGAPVKIPVIKPEPIREEQAFYGEYREPNEYREPKINRNLIVMVFVVLAIIVALLVIIIFQVIKGTDTSKGQSGQVQTASTMEISNYIQEVSGNEAVSQAETVTETEQPTRQLSLEEQEIVDAIRIVMDNNIIAVNEMFFFGNKLHTSSEILDGWENAVYGVYVVDDERFSTYDKYTSFLFSTYIEDTATNKFINMVRYLPGKSTGRLGCITDQDRTGAVEAYHPDQQYTVDWSSYEIEIPNFEAGKTEYDFKAIAKDGYVASGTVRKSGSSWLLIDAVY